MTTCREIAELATDHAEGQLDPSARAGFEAHLASCAACTAYVRQLEVAARAVARIPEPEISPQLREELFRRFDDWAATRAAAEPSGWRTRASVPAVLAAMAALVAFARHRSQSPREWGVAAALAAVALALGARAGRFALGVAASAVAAAVAAALLAGGSGPLDLGQGLECLATQLASAAGVGGVAWLAVRRGTTERMRRALATGAVVGALGATAALQLTCPAHEALLHLLAFHAGGVAVVAAAALLLLRRPARPAGA
jgi:hypothetical protein